MKSLLVAVVALPLTLSVFADDVVPKAIHKMVDLHVADHGLSVVELKVTKTDTDTKVLLGVPLKVALPDGCTQVVGQRDYSVRVGIRRFALGVRFEGTNDPMTDVCPTAKADPVGATLSLTFTISPNADPSTVYFQDVLIDGQWARITYQPSAKGGAIELINHAPVASLSANVLR